MPPLFDPRTAFLVGACTAALGALTFAALQPMYRADAASLRRYAAAMATTAAGLLLLSMRGFLPPMLAHAGANTLMSFGIVACVDATMRLFGRTPPTWLFVLQLAGLALLWAWLGDDPQRAQLRVVAFSAVHTLWPAAIAWMIGRTPRWRRQGYAPALRWLFVGYAGAHLARAVTVWLGASVSGGALTPGTSQIAFVLIFVLSPIALAQIVQMILHARVSGELHRRATTDELTGLYSRAYFFELARERLRRPHPAGTVHHLLMIDLDHFKSVNDRYGHSVGDRALRHAARVLHGAIRPCGFVGRYGGEEFCALIRSHSDDGAKRIIDGVRKAVAAAPLRSGDAVIALTASIGAVPVGDAESLERVLVHADHCVYRAKAEGRNRVVRQGEILAEPIV